ncbi:Nitrogen permease regulator 2 [Marasmius sp. AFHP31]|nr:Nitrogen permease regulator 2 [Marasmius sp. AFHP31]
MAGDGDSFLPRIQSVFYAGFDVVTGPKIIYQVPEGLIGAPHPIPQAATPFSNPSSPNLVPGQLPPTSSTHSIVSPIDYRSSSRLLHSPGKRSSSTLFNFEEISKYVIPPPALCGRLVICSTKRYRIIGFPVQLEGEKYQQNYRNFFRFNLCFVFERVADLSCYEPIVRKISRVLTSCESLVRRQEESSFLSSPETSPTMHAVLEQLYEDLNSYSETSIPIDQFNSIELKIFPFYPNPPPVHDWMVPLALINLTKRIEDNWDLTMAKPGKTVSEWMQAHAVHELGIDVRRFTSFGVIKGFLRRVHRWPVLLQTNVPPGSPDPYAPARKRVQSFTGAFPLPNAPKVNSLTNSPSSHQRGRSHNPIGTQPTFAVTTDHAFSPPPTPGETAGGIPSPKPSPTAHDIVNRIHGRTRRSSAAERILEHLRSRDIAIGTSPRSLRTYGPSNGGPSSSSPLNSNPSPSHHTPQQSPAGTRPSFVAVVGGKDSENRNQSLLLHPTSPHPASPTVKKVSLAPPPRPRISRSPSAPVVRSINGVLNPVPLTASPYPPEIVELLDGEHHTDELAVRFQAGWPLLEQWLTAIGEGEGNGDFGRVCIIYR